MQPLPVVAQPCPTLPCCHCFPTARPKAATSRSTCYHHRPCSSLAAPVVLDPTSVRSSERIVATTAAHHALPLLPSPPSSSASIFQPLAQLPMLLPRPSQSAFLPYRSRLQPRPLSLPSSQSPLPLILFLTIVIRSPDKILLSAVAAWQHRRLLPRQSIPTLSVLSSAVQRQLMLHPFCYACPVPDLLSAMFAPSFLARLT
ncbi:hypothetical protein BHE74_00046931 [Ensete ventricosum]|nr:hypothetical protein BHE74_00046931 [Ensete ventricosum]